MTPKEYLDAAKKSIGITSDNELANRLEANRGTISAIRDGKRGVPIEIAFRIAITLKLDPATVWADLESQQETNPKRAKFWKSFLSRATLGALLVCTLAWSSIGISDRTAEALGGMMTASAAFFYARRVRII